MAESQDMHQAQTHVVANQDSGVILERLIAMGKAYRVEGNQWQAMEIFWEIVEDYPEAPQSAEARNILLEFARNYERNGARHLARDIYERLL